MCGISGLININREYSNQTKILKKTVDSLKHRGPDDEGYVFFNDEPHIYFGADTLKEYPKVNSFYRPVKNIQEISEIYSNVCFGHRRLSIIDLSENGHQPMCDPSQNFWIIYNGEIFNYNEICDELKQLGCKFFSTSDTEVILKSYMQWGEKCLDKFNGMFAFAIFNRKQQEVFIARDRIGIKPLYYGLIDNKLVFASELSALIRSGAFEKEINFEGLWHNLSFGMIPGELTCFKNIYKLQPGHFICIKNNAFSITQYYDLPIGKQNNVNLSDSLSKLEEEIEKAIQYVLVSDVEVATTMSGGIDSTTATAIANKYHFGIKAFTLGYTNSNGVNDEVEYAKEVAKKNSIEHIIKNYNGDDIVNNLNIIVSNYFEEPYWTLFPDYILYEHINLNNIKVVLNGLGPDELLAGYPYYIKMIDYWNKLRHLSVPLKLIPYNLHHKIDEAKYLSCAKGYNDFYVNQYSRFKEREKKKLFLTEHQYNSIEYVNQQFKIEQKQFSDYIEALNYLDVKTYIGSHHVLRQDKWSMQHSIESRFPFLDHNFVEACFQLPSAYKIHDNIHKYPLKHIAEKYLGKRVINKKKTGFSLPMEVWINTKLKKIVENEISDLKERELFNNKTVDNYLNRIKVEPFKIWNLVMIELWLKNYIDK